MKKIKVLHIISSLKIGGAEALLCSLIEHLNTADFEHHVIYFHDGPHRKTLSDMGISTYHIRGMVWQYDLSMIFRLIHTIKKINPDVIHGALWAANFFARLIGRLLNIKTVNAVHLIVEDDGRVRNTLDRLTLRFADNLVAVSPRVAESVIKNFKITQDLIVIANGINYHALLTKSQLNLIDRASVGLTDKHFIIGCVARFVSFKNHSLLLESFAQLVEKYPHARLILVGIGPLEKQLREQAQTLEITEKVFFIIGQPAYRYYPLFDCFVQPSAYEGLSVALLESLCFKLPVIVTGIDQKHDVITHDTSGLVIEPNNRAALRKALAQLVGNPPLCKELGEEGFFLVKNQYTLDSMANKYKQIFQKSVGALLFLLVYSSSITGQEKYISEIIHTDPDITLIHNFITDAEAEELKKLSLTRMRPSFVGDSQLDERRTSESAMFINGENDFIKTLEERAAALVGLPSSLVEIQVVHYGPGQKFDAHYDYLDADLKQKRGTQRIFTLLVYLNDVQPGHGGETFFPKLDLKITPKKNSAALWRNILVNGAEDDRTLHAGLPITQGEKWAANIWLHETTACCDVQ